MPNGFGKTAEFPANSTPNMEKKRLWFDGNVADYEAFRPGYPEELYRDVLRYSGIETGKRALEVGIGTGKATEPFLKTGCQVTAVEVGKNLAEFAREKFHSYPNLSVLNLPFEKFGVVEDGYDCVYSATAFHWIPEQAGFHQVHRLLKSGGTLALWWNRPFPSRPGDGLYEDIQRVYAKYRPENRNTPRQNRNALYRKMRETILSYGFKQLEFRLYQTQRTFDADGYVGVLNTYSDHGGFPPDAKHDFEKEIRNAICRHGNQLTVYDTVDLYLARKP